MTVSDEDIISEILSQTAQTRSVAPRDVAQALAEGDAWRSLLPRIKRLSQTLAVDGRLVMLRKGKPAVPTGLRGVYRLAAPDSSDES